MLHQRIQLPNCPMDVYVPAKDAAPHLIRPSIVICPGGGYSHLSPREAEPVALTFAAMGFNAYVVWYRVAPNRHPAPLHDVASAVAWVREHAAEHMGDPDAIAVAGFSAGGHAAANLGVRWHDEALMAQAGLTPEQVKPNALVLCYPVLTGGEFAHRDSFVQLTGSQDPLEHEQHSIEKLVTDKTPPTFLWHTFEDRFVPPENTLFMAAALSRVLVTSEVHIFPYGGHGLALARPQTSAYDVQNVAECAQWPEMAARFLRSVMLK